MIYLYGIVVPENIHQCDFEHMFSLVSKERQLRIKKFHFDKDKKRSMLAELLFRYILEKELNIVEDNLLFIKNEYGKPSVSNYENIFFNFSHSGEWVLCAVSDRKIGVDVEIIQEKNLNIAERFFTNEEYTWLHKKDEKEQYDCFYKIWTLKESYIKAEGKGLSIPLDSFSFLFENEIELKVNNQIVNNYQFLSDKLDEKHTVALCYEALPKDQIEIKKDTIDYDILLQWAKNKIG